MKFYRREEAVRRMDALAEAGKPFVFAVDYAGENACVEEPDAIDPDEWQYDLNGFTNERDAERRTPELSAFPMPFDEYARGFGVVRRNILAGNSYLVNYTCPTPVRCDVPCETLFHASKALYRMWLRGKFVVFSPEIFVRMSDGMIRSYPMKGTISAGIEDAEKRLMEDGKEQAEHATIVDLIRNDLSLVARRVRVARYRYVDRLHTDRGDILQTSSEIVGELSPAYRDRPGSLLFGMLPAGSITGAPKPRTMRIIAEAEKDGRGFYTGVGGYWDGERLDSFVMIRFVEEGPDGLLFRSGGGITCRSEAESEYEEMKQKVYVPFY